MAGVQSPPAYHTNQGGRERAPNYDGTQPSIYNDPERGVLFDGSWIVGSSSPSPTADAPVDDDSSSSE